MEFQMPENSSPLALLLFFFMFLFVYVFAYLVVLQNWGPKHRIEASSCFISLAHGSPVVIMAIIAILQAPNMADFAALNTKYQGLVLEYSMAYFLMDLLHYILFYPRDFVFICHHLAVLYVFATCHYLVRRGALPILVLLVLAEFSSGCQNVWTLAGYRRADVPAAAKFQDFVSPYFFTFYSILRGGFAPVFLHKMGEFYVSSAAENLIPKWAWISWMGVIGTAILVSILWVGNHWVLWFRRTKHGKAV
ncbi:TLC domain-containing protein At5g14285-like [Cucurbita pepo subsp. pepo]|uniref:TLC domain-containing protein At5g14285-like n=1 Tax=Cucurbita pepo subsp. pepo TaxID=3664 RepID=UPI000C9D2F9F|nr:TLC domain-containing protein At5g14285-like [Cucurbita pepo subsp. pepo]